MWGVRRHCDEVPEQVPAGIMAPEKHTRSRIYPGTDRVWLDDGLKILAHPATVKAFEVTPSHELLPAPELGVRFKVEDTVPEPADLAMPTITRDQSLAIAKAMAVSRRAGKAGVVRAFSRSLRRPPVWRARGSHGGAAVKAHTATAATR